MPFDLADVVRETLGTEEGVIIRCESLEKAQTMLQALRAALREAGLLLGSRRLSPRWAEHQEWLVWAEWPQYAPKNDPKAPVVDPGAKKAF